MSSTSNAAGILIQHRDKFLLCKRGYFGASLDGFWAPPAGRIETGEVAINAAIRELYEEGGVLLRREELLLLSKERRADNKGWFYLYHHTSPVLRHLTLNLEHEGYAYFCPTELPSPICPMLKKLILSLTNHLEI